MERLLQHPESSITEFFCHDPHRKTEIVDAIAAVRPYRNDASHRGTIDPGTVDDLVNRWLGRSKPGYSIFAALFPLEL
jgi:hypothetical protein